MERLASVDARIDNIVATETIKYFSVCDNPLVEMHPAANLPLRSSTEGQAGSSNQTFNHPPDEAVEAEQGPNDPFWRTSLGQAIVDYGTTTIEPEPSILSFLRRGLENALANKEFF